MLLNFGNSLANSPTATDLGNYDGKLSRPRGLSLRQDGDDLVLVVVNRGDNTIAIINFGTSITNTILSDDVLKSSAMPDASIPLDLSLIKDCSIWYGFTVSLGNGNLHRLEFGPTLYNTPTFTTELLSGISDLYQLELRHDGELFRALIQGSTGLHRLDFENGIDQSPSLVDLTSTGLENLSGITLLADTLGFAINNSTRELYRLDFQQSCSATIKYSTAFEPTGISYDSSGDFVISLKSTDGNGNSSYHIDTVTITSDTSPDISFIIDDSRCISNENTFTSSNISGDITGYQWIFGSDTLSPSTTAIDTVYQFASARNYDVTLSVSSSGGCTNFTRQNLSVYDDPPTPTFNTASTTLCTDTEISFINTTDETGYDEVLSYQWIIAGDTVDQLDTVYTFLTAGEKIISLQSFIPGCESIATSDTLDLIDGPGVSFNYVNNCFGEPVEFTSDISGSGIDTYLWNFDDGGTSSQADTSYQFSVAGDYNVNLTVTNISGCSSDFSDLVQVNDESLTAIAFSEAVENLPVDFNGIDETLSGDSIVSWNWDFDGLFTSSAQDTSLTFSVPQDYTITLSINTAQGCNEEIIESSDS